MKYKLACKDVGVDCSYVAEGKTHDGLMRKVIKHGKEAHGYTDEQLKDPKMMKMVKGAIRKE